MGNTILVMMTRSIRGNHILDTQSGFFFTTLSDFLLSSLTCQQDTFRAEWAWEIFFVPERIPGMVTSMLQDYIEVINLNL